MKEFINGYIIRVAKEMSKLFEKHDPKYTEKLQKVCPQYQRKTLSD